MEQLGGQDLPIDGRLRLAAALVVLVFAVFGLRLFQLQIIEGDDLIARSQRNAVRTLRIPAPRGEILDRHGTPIASFRPARELHVLPDDLDRRDVTFAALAQLLGRDAAEMSERVGSPRGARRFVPVTLDSDLDDVSLARVAEHGWAMPGVSTVAVPRRHYIEGRLAAHLLGTLGEVSAEQLGQPGYEGVRGGDEIGQTGLEARFEDHLRGRDGGRNVIVDVAGREVEVIDEVAPVPGGRVVLALDLPMQRAAEAAFLDVPEGEPEKMGAAVALDVHTGDVLAMTSHPNYDPNAFAGGVDAETWKGLIEDEWKPLRNRAIQNHYPPGSIHKAIVAAALLEEGIIDENSTVNCTGSFRFGDRSYRCWKRGGHGVVNLRTAIKRSCDVFFYTYGVQLGIDRLAKHARTFGLGQRSGIDLGGEQPGVLPSSAWKERRFGEPWYPGETVSAAIGQGYNLYTPLQLAVAYAAIANGGTLLRPRVVLRLEDERGITKRRYPPKEVGRVSVSPEHLAQVRAGLRAVVEEPGGTGGRARIPGLAVAGKTGTAQVVRLDEYEGVPERDIPLRFRDHAWFAAYAPADDPQIAVGVFVEHGLHGASAAAPIAKRIIEAWWRGQQTPADDDGSVVAHVTAPAPPVAGSPEARDAGH